MISLKKIITLLVVLVLLCSRVYVVKAADIHNCSNHDLTTIEKHNTPISNYAMDLIDDEDVDLSKKNQNVLSPINNLNNLSNILNTRAYSRLFIQKEFYSTRAKQTQSETSFLMSFRI